MLWDEYIKLNTTEVPQPTLCNINQKMSAKDSSKDYLKAGFYGANEILTFNDVEICVYNYAHKYLYQSVVVYISKVWHGDHIFDRHIKNQPIKLQIQDKYYSLVHQMLAQSGVENNGTKYIVLNWRSETVPKSHLQGCAVRLIQAAVNWSSSKKYKGYKLILVSDISFSSNITLWGGQTGMYNRELVSILNSTFLKLETLSSRDAIVQNEPMYADRIFLSIWDYILSLDAELFVTCSSQKECKHCTRWNSNYVGNIVRHRDSMNRKSVDKWEGADHN